MEKSWKLSACAVGVAAAAAAAAAVLDILVFLAWGKVSGDRGAGDSLSLEEQIVVRYLVAPSEGPGSLWGTETCCTDCERSSEHWDIVARMNR